MILDLISQSVLNEVAGNSEDSMPNKIKEKEESLQNTLNKRYSIPMISLDDETSKENNSMEEYSNVASESANENANRVEQEIQNYYGEYESRKYTVIDIGVNSLLEGDEKPINVKEHMIINIMKKSINNISDINSEETNAIEENSEDIAYEEHIINDDFEKKVEFDNTSDIADEMNNVMGQYGIPANIERILSSTFDFDTTMVAINQTRKQFKDVSEEANIAAQEADKSDELLQKVSDEYTEVERQLKEKEQRSKEMEQKIISILTSEKDRLSQQMHEKEAFINNANKRKEQNNDKIVNFRSKINSTMEKANEIDEKISRQEELLNTLVGFNINLDDYQNNNSKSNGKVS